MRLLKPIGMGEHDVRRLVMKTPLLLLANPVATSAKLESIKVMCACRQARLIVPQGQLEPTSLHALPGPTLRHRPGDVGVYSLSLHGATIQGHSTLKCKASRQLHIMAWAFKAKLASHPAHLSHHARCMASPLPQLECQHVLETLRGTHAF